MGGRIGARLGLGLDLPHIGDPSLLHLQLAVDHRHLFKDPTLGARESKWSFRRLGVEGVGEGRGWGG